SFFFSLFLHHLDLHSFPTRRSSDLGWKWPTSFYRFLGPLPLDESAQLIQHLPTAVQVPGLPAEEGRVPGPHVEPRRSSSRIVGKDRKSTRLNSSHLVISYAVFCLKK